MRRLGVLAVGGLLLTTSLVAAPGAIAADELETIEGTLTKDGDDYAIDETKVNFGPTRYIEATTASADYDGDGATETIANEVDGLVDTAVTLEGRKSSCGGGSWVPKRVRRLFGLGGGGGGDCGFEVYTIGDAPYRDPNEERPPWAGPGGDSEP